MAFNAVVLAPPASHCCPTGNTRVRVCCTLQLKIGDFGMARQVLPPPPTTTTSTSRTSSPMAHTAPGAAAAATAVMSARRSPQNSHNGGCGGGANSAPNTPKAPQGPAARTFTPGIVGTITYTAPEVLGVMEEQEQQQQQQPSVEHILKVSKQGTSISKEFRNVDVCFHCCHTYWVGSHTCDMCA